MKRGTKQREQRLISTAYRTTFTGCSVPRTRLTMLEEAQSSRTSADRGDDGVQRLTFHEPAQCGELRPSRPEEVSQNFTTLSSAEYEASKRPAKRNRVALAMQSD